MYQGDWLRLGQFVREAGAVGRPRVSANVWALGLTSLLTDVSSEMIVSILPAYLVLTNGLAPLALGLANGLHEGGPILALLVGGYAADRSGRRKLTAVFGYALSAACRLGWFIVSGRAIAAIAALILTDRLGKALRTAPRDALISLSARPGGVTTAFGVHRALDAAGAALGPLLAFVLLWQLPRRYDTIFFGSFVIALLGLAALTLLVADVPRPAFAGEFPDGPAGANAFFAFFDSRLRRVAVLAMAFGLFTIGDAFIYLLVVRRSMANPQWIPLLYTGTATAFFLLAIPLGYLADRIGPRRVFILGHAPLLLTYAVVLGDVQAWPWNAVACVCLLGTYYASCDGVLAGFAAGLLPERHRATGLAGIATAAGGARLCSSLLFGLLWTYAGDTVAIVCFGVALLVVTAVAFTSFRLDDQPVAA